MVEAAPEADQLAGAAFYCVVEERYFLGAVGLVNSLRLVGHAEPIYLLDCGLSAEQRALLAPHARLVPWSGEAPALLLEAVAPLRHPAEVMVLIDADMIVTRPLTELIERAAGGNVVAVEHGQERFVAEWGELLGLGPVRRQAYLSGGLLFLGQPLGREILELMAELQQRIDFRQTYWGDNVPDYPFLYGDQDVLNAILSSRVPPERIVAVDRRVEAVPPFEGLTIDDELALRCSYADGHEPHLLHHYGTKPWLEPTPDGVYSRLLRRLLSGPGLAIEPGAHRLPLHLRSGLLADAVRSRASGRGLIRSYFGEPLSTGARALRGRVKS